MKDEIERTIYLRVLSTREYYFQHANMTRSTCLDYYAVVSLLQIHLQIRSTPRRLTAPRSRPIPPNAFEANVLCVTPCNAL